MKNVHMTEFKNAGLNQSSVSDLVINNINSKNGGKREKSKRRELDLTELKTLSFAKHDRETFILPELAKFAIKQGGVLPAVMNAANEIAVGLFLHEKIRFLDIFDSVEKAVSDWEHKNIKNPNIDDIIESAEDVKRNFVSKYL